MQYLDQCPQTVLALPGVISITLSRRGRGTYFRREEFHVFALIQVNATQQHVPTAKDVVLLPGRQAKDLDGILQLFCSLLISCIDILPKQCKWWAVLGVPVTMVVKDFCYLSKISVTFLLSWSKTVSFLSHSSCCSFVTKVKMCMIFTKC